MTDKSRKDPRGDISPFWFVLLRWAARIRKTVRSLFSRRWWSVRLLRLEQAGEPGDEPGLILVQIDGLSRTQLERAIEQGRMPFLQELRTREGYQLQSFYSSVPATTPAVQGELFYGVKTAVPAFHFREEATGKLISMTEEEPAVRRQATLEGRGAGLAEGGSCYSSIYTAGAAEPSFCASAMGWGEFFQSTTPSRSLMLWVWNFMSILRALWMMAVEIVLAFVDVIRGVANGQGLIEELKFVPHRVAVGVLLREYITIGAEVDATRGLPVIILNYLGYDEQAHRRGPGSRFAHLSLKQIDRCIRRVSEAALHSEYRDYQLWIFSDHGQEKTLPYEQLTGQSLAEAILEIDPPPGAEPPKLSRRQRGELEGANWIGGLFKRLTPGTDSRDKLAEAGGPQVAALGPVGHVYWPEPLKKSDRHRIIKRLIEEKQIPLICAVDGETVTAWTPEGKFQLPEHGERLFGANHPFRREITEDWIRLCRHPEAGDIVVSGWTRNGQLLTFVTENGAHAGPGPEETGGFALFPCNSPLAGTPRDYLRALDLRAGALQLLNREPRPDRRAPRKHEPAVAALRILTYNVHSCFGVDGKLSPRRIAHVIAQSRPDIVALQEVDVGRSRSREQDQIKAIARELGMEFHFHPAFTVEKEQYGNAILSHLPMQLVRADSLPTLQDGLHRELRGALWVAVDLGDGQAVQVVNTHLGLSPRERRQQVEALLGPDWLGHADCTGPVVLCGDFNDGPSSPAYKQIIQTCRDAQREPRAGRVRNTWASQWPIRRLDYVFVRGPLEVAAVDVPRGRLARLASDHSPLLVELTLNCGEGEP